MLSTVTNGDEQWIAMLRALGQPVRLGIVRRLAVEAEICACDFAEVFGVSQPTISQHLKVLRKAGLVTTRRRGTQICYSVNLDTLDQLTEMLTGLSSSRLAPATS
jgi:ArsR family transcriptional regulator